MKMVKAMKKLKFWSRKKKKTKTVFVEPPPPPPPCHCQHYQYYYQVEPSAPPLPLSSSFDYDHQSCDNSESIPFTSSSQAQAESPVQSFPPEENNSVPPLSPRAPALSAAPTASYQQYMVPNPVYAVPLAAQPVRREAGGRAFGCVFTLGAHLFRCFFPCFYIQEAQK